MTVQRRNKRVVYEGNTKKNFNNLNVYEKTVSRDANKNPGDHSCTRYNNVVDLFLNIINF